MPRLMAILVTDFSVAIHKVFFGFKSQILTTLVKINITCHQSRAEVLHGQKYSGFLRNVLKYIPSTLQIVLKYRCT